MDIIPAQSTAITHVNTIYQRVAWKSICGSLAKAWLRAHRDYHRRILGHRSYTQIRKSTYTCKDCGFTVTKTVSEIHASVTGQSIAEAEALFAQLDRDVIAWREKIVAEARSK